VFSTDALAIKKEKKIENEIGCHGNVTGAYMHAILNAD
jgi:hypothetical protein